MKFILICVLAVCSCTSFYEKAMDKCRLICYENDKDLVAYVYVDDDDVITCACEDRCFCENNKTYYFTLEKP
jgi:hypothetical protein